jgi:hypothetical protein
VCFCPLPAFFFCLSFFVCFRFDRTIAHLNSSITFNFSLKKDIENALKLGAEMKTHRTNETQQHKQAATLNTVYGEGQVQAARAWTGPIPWLHVG